MNIVAGVDIGSVAAKALILSEKGIMGYSVVPTGANCNEAAQKALNNAIQKANIKKEDIKYIMATGYGRRAINFGNNSITEISANAKGAIFLARKIGQIRTIINVGGQDVKVITLDEKGTITNFLMNDKCAAGTGRFLEVISKALEEDIETFSKISLESTNPAKINSTCTVFAESEVISLVAQNVPKKDIIAGIHKSVAKRISDMTRAAGAQEKIFFDGGGAKNIGLTTAVKKTIGKEIHITKIPQFTVALGAALLAYEQVKKQQ